MKWRKDIDVRIIAKTVLQSDVYGWLKELGASEYIIPEERTHSDGVVGLAAKRCYNSFIPGLNPNVTKVRENWTEYLDNILKSGHGSVLEHATWTFAIEGCTRVFTAEMNRHRAGVAISEASMRYIRLDEIEMWLPPSLIVTESDDLDLKDLKEMTVATMGDVVRRIEVNYKALVEQWNMNALGFDQKKKITSMLRRMLPMGICTGGVWTLNARALRHVIALRSTAHAEEEIAFVMSKVGKMMFESEPNLFGDFEQVEGGFWVPKYTKV